MASLPRASLRRAALFCLASCFYSASGLDAASIPSVQATALDGHTVALPRDLPIATILIMGFGRHSSDATTAWEKPTRAQFAHTPNVTFYDMAMLAEVPRFARGFAVGRIRKAVPDLLKPNFLPLFDHEDEWKQAAAFDAHQEDAAYVLLVDREGRIGWSTHQPFTQALFAQLTQAAQALASANASH